MRICLVGLDFPPFRSSGLTVYVENVARQLARRGHEVTVLAAQRRKSPRDDLASVPRSVHVVRVPIGKADWIGLGWQAARYLRTNRSEFDVVHFADVHFAYAFRGGYVASAWQSFRQRLCSDHGHPYHSSGRNYLFRLSYYSVARWLMEQPSVRRAAHVVMPSRATLTEFVQHYGLDMARTTLIYPGLDLESFRRLPPRAEARQRLGLPDDAPVVLYVGFSTPRKGVEYLAQAMVSLPSKTCLVMVGRWEEGYQARFLAALGAARPRTRLLGYVPDAELQLCYAAADALVLPSLLEGLGIPPIEAMAAGLPVVVTAGGAAEEVVGEAGLTVPPCDSLALGAALGRVLSDSDLRVQLGEIGRKRAFSLFDPEQATSKLESVYHAAQGAKP